MMLIFPRIVRTCPSKSVQRIYAFLQDFFERKKLAGKVQRIRPSLSKVKTAISQDLLFLKATASATKSKPGKRHKHSFLSGPLNMWCPGIVFTPEKWGQYRPEG
jgi:hypothetical protein